MKRSNKKILKYFMVMTGMALIIISIFVVVFFETNNENIVLNMKDGYEDKDVVEYYK